MLKNLFILSVLTVLHCVSSLSTGTSRFLDATPPTPDTIQLYGFSQMYVNFVNSSTSNSALDPTGTMIISLYTSYTVISKSCNNYNLPSYFCSLVNNCPSTSAPMVNLTFNDYNLSGQAFSPYMTLNVSDWALNSPAYYTTSTCISTFLGFSQAYGIIGLGFNGSAVNNYASPPYFSFSLYRSYGNLTFNPDVSGWSLASQLPCDANWQISGVSSLQLGFVNVINLNSTPTNIIFDQTSSGSYFPSSIYSAIISAFQGWNMSFWSCSTSMSYCYLSYYTPYNDLPDLIITVGTQNIVIPPQSYLGAYGSPGNATAPQTAQFRLFNLSSSFNQQYQNYIILGSAVMQYYNLVFDGRSSTPTVSLYNNNMSVTNTSYPAAAAPSLNSINLIQGDTWPGYYVNATMVNLSLPGSILNLYPPSYFISNLSISLYSSNTVLQSTDKGIGTYFEQQYACYIYNTCPQNLSTLDEPSFPYFTATTTNVSAYINVNSNQWNLNNPALQSTLDLLEDPVFSPNTIGMIGLGFNGSAINNFASPPYFGVTFYPGGGSVNFNPNTTGWTLVNQLPCNADWQIVGVASINVSNNQRTVSSPSGIIFDMDSDALYFPPNIYSFLRSFVFPSSLVGLVSSFDPTGANVYNITPGTTLGSFPNITITVGTQLITIPPQLYIKNALGNLTNSTVSSSITSRIKSTTYYYTITGPYLNYFVFNSNFMSYYNTIFDGRGPTPTISLYGLGPSLNWTNTTVTGNTGTGNTGGSTGGNSGSTGGSTGGNNGSTGGSTGSDNGSTGGSTGSNNGTIEDSSDSDDGTTGGSTGGNNGSTGSIDTGTGTGTGTTGGSTGSNGGTNGGSIDTGTGNTGGSTGSNSGSTNTNTGGSTGSTNTGSTSGSGNTNTGGTAGSSDSNTGESSQTSGDKSSSGGAPVAVIVIAVIVGVVLVLGGYIYMRRRAAAKRNAQESSMNPLQTRLDDSMVRPSVSITY